MGNFEAKGATLAEVVAWVTRDTDHRRSTLGRHLIRNIADPWRYLNPDRIKLHRLWFVLDGWRAIRPDLCACDIEEYATPPFMVRLYSEDDRPWGPMAPEKLYRIWYSALERYVARRRNVKIHLTASEARVLRALLKSAEGNGNDFGFIEDARGAVGKRQLAGVVSSLVKKELLVVWPTFRPDPNFPPVTQFTWPRAWCNQLADKLTELRTMVDRAAR